MDEETRRRRLVAALQAFLETPLDAHFAARRGIDPTARAIAFFHEVARDVPAYGAFLREHGVDSAAVSSPEAFARLPLVTKADYLKKHPLPALCRGGSLLSSETIAASSGSTGDPMLWPRSLADEVAVAVRFEQVFLDSFEADRKRTLAVVCFPLGTWIGGMFTATCCRHLATKGYPIFTVTPGNAKAEILHLVKELGPLFEQTVLLGYPPFLKDVIDSGNAGGIHWRDRAVKLVLAGEVFTEEWRTLMGARAGMTRPLLDSASLYGTADAGVLGNETPLTIAIRRFLAERPEDARALFGEGRLPTLVQFDPCARYFEVHEGTLVFTGDNGIPLVRYHISDDGGVVPYGALIARLRALGFDAVQAATDAGARTLRELPFVYVFGRSHFALSFFGANIFPEMVSVGLEQPQLVAHVTGKFVMELVKGEDFDVELAIAVELAPGVAGDASLEGAIAQSILEHLLRLDPEFGAYVPKERQLPRVTLHATGDPGYFPVGVKHRYSRR
jgi:phenylacetate-CoA ligase